MTAMSAPRQPQSRFLVRLVRIRWRLFVGTIFALGVFRILPAEWRVMTRTLLAWDAGVSFYLALIYFLMARASVDYIRRRAALEDETRIGILVLTVGAALASLGAIVAELGTSHALGSERQLHNLLLAVLTILLSWGLTHTVFALHYAHEFYGESEGPCGGLLFPGQGDPDYWDFVYFSFVIGMTSQVSDVAVADKSIRRTVAAHGVISFVFNAALLALTVNIAASAI